MTVAANVVLEPENGGTARVLCGRCREEIGRLQTEPPQGENRTEWSAEVRGEIDLMAHEHEALCPALHRGGGQ